MRLTTRLRSNLLVCAFALSAAAVGATAQTPATAPAPAAPAGAADRKVMEGAAAAYAGYQVDVSSIRAKPLSGAPDLDKALDKFGAQNADQLSSGWISYSAMVAAQNPEFAKSVRDKEAFEGRAKMIDGFKADESYARQLKGGEGALQNALLVNEKDTGRIASAAAYVKEQAYKLQDVAWGKTRAKDPSATAAALKISAKDVKPVADAASKLFAGPDLGVMLASASASGGQSSIWDRVTTLTASAPTATLAGLTPASGPSALSQATAQAKVMKVDPKREGTANRIVTMAAFHVLNAESSHTDDVKTGMKDQSTQDCIDWSQIQLRACVSAAYTRADLSFCLAEHAIRDPGACFSNVAR
jgi:hypothetical protein